MSIVENLETVKKTLSDGVELVAVSKTYPPEAINEAYQVGQRIFGENRPQEMVEKYNILPKDIKWHMIGSLQTNKVKYIAPFVDMIHSIDSPKLLAMVQKEAVKNNRTIDVLFEIYIADEATKHGWDFDNLLEFVKSGELNNFPNVRFRGVMSMATYTDNQNQIKQEFSRLRNHFETLKQNIETFDTISMGMSGDYQLAMQCGSTMVRIGGMIFGARTYTK